MSGYVTRLHEVLDDLRQDAARLERVGRGLSDAEQRRVDALRSAADLLQRAADALSDTEADPARPAPAPSREQPRQSEAPPLYERSSDADMMENSGLAGDDDTPGYDRDRDAY